MNVYLAARYSRREEMLGYAMQLEELGLWVTSRWITGCHEKPGRDDRATTGPTAYTVEEREVFAEEDLLDLMQSDLLIAFTEPESAKASRGGRHVEFGFALGKGIPCIVIGTRENVFHCLERVRWFETWEEFREWLLHSNLLKRALAGREG